MFVVAAVLAMGCGGGSPNSGDEAIGKAAFVAKVNAICATTQKRIVGGGVARVLRVKDDRQAREKVETELVVDLLIPTLKQAVAEIRALGAPSGDDARIDAFLRATEEAIHEAQTEPRSYVTVGGHYRSGAHHFGKARNLANAYGLSGCPVG